MDSITAITAVIGSVVAVGSLASGVWQYRRKVHLEIFRHYADAYNRIVTPDVYRQWQAAIEGTRDHWHELTPKMIDYLNLTWEEFFLSRTGVIPRRLWKLWQPEICLVLSSDFARVTMEANQFHFPPELTGDA